MAALRSWRSDGLTGPSDPLARLAFSFSFGGEFNAELGITAASSIPVEVRTPDLELLLEMDSDAEPVAVEAGTYVYTAYLPDGRVDRRVIRLKPGDSALVPLGTTDPNPREGPPRWEPVAPSRHLTVTPFDLKYFGFVGMAEVEPLEGPVHVQESVGTAGATTFYITIPEEMNRRVVFLQVSPTNEEPVCLALPVLTVGAEASCRVRVSGSSRGPEATAILVDPRADLALRYAQEGITAFARRLAEQIPYGEVPNLGMGTALALAIPGLRHGATKGYAFDVSEDVAFELRSSDLAILAARKTTAEPGRQAERIRLLDGILKFGPPIYNDLLSVAVAMVDELLADGRIQPDDRERVAKLAQALANWLPFLDGGTGSTVTFRGLDFGGPAVPKPRELATAGS